MLALLIAAAVGAAPAESDVFKVIDLYTACREKPFPQPQHDVASIEVAKDAYVRKHGGTAQARKRIEMACELYRLAYDDGLRMGHAVQEALSPETKDAIKREIERQFGPLEASPASNQ